MALQGIQSSGNWIGHSNSSVAVGIKAWLTGFPMKKASYDISAIAHP